MPLRAPRQCSRAGGPRAAAVPRRLAVKQQARRQVDAGARHARIVVAYSRAAAERGAERANARRSFSMRKVSPAIEWISAATSGRPAKSTSTWGRPRANISAAADRRLDEPR